MKKYFIIISLFLATVCLSFGQTNDAFRSNCVMSAGQNAKFLKDFRIELGKASKHSELRYKANMSLWKNTKYRFTLCNADKSDGQLILNIKDDANKVVLSSVDQKSGKVYPSVDYVCNKSGIYQLNYDFTNGQQGSGVGVVSMIK
jgi:hypothetical protein